MKRHTNPNWPTKRTLNLVIREKTWSSPSRVTPLLVAIILAAALFSKLAVADRLAQVSRSEAENARLRQSISQLRADYADYDRVESQYRRYSYGSLSETERALPDRLAVLDLLEAKLLPAAQVKNMAVGGNSLSLTLAGITLEQTSGLVASLEDSDIVDSVAVYTAGYDQNRLDGEEIRLLTMTITLAQAWEGGEG